MTEKNPATPESARHLWDRVKKQGFDEAGVVKTIVREKHADSSERVYALAARSGGIFMKGSWRHAPHIPAARMSRELRKHQTLIARTDMSAVGR